MNREDFKMISIRGRVAYSIRCLENVLIQYKCNTDKWIFILEKLWSYTDIDFFDDWHYCMAELIPESVLESEDYQPDDFDFITESQFKEAYQLYSTTEGVIKDTINMIFDIGISEFYGRLENYGQKTLVNLERLLVYLKTKAIALPDIDNFRKLSYEIANGWGDKFSGKEYSSIL